MSRLDLILRQGEAFLYVNGKLEPQVCDIGILGGQIAEIAPRISTPAAEEIDLKGLTVLPGLIDSQVHFREPGLTHKEDLDTGTQAALLGGITTVFEMPNTMPPTIHWSDLDDKVQRAQGRAHCHYAFFAGAADSNIDELSKLEKHPHTPGIKIFMGSSTGSLLIENDELLERVFQNTKRRVIIHSEDEIRLRERKHLAKDDVHQHPVWRDVETAVSSTRRLLKLAEKYQHPVHVLHISTAEEIELLKEHRALASVEVLPNHLTLWAPDCYDRLGNFAQQNPPIREKRHRDALWKAIENGYVDVIGSDHAPHTKEEKERPYPQSPSGTPGVQTLLPVMLNHVHQGRLSLQKLTEMLSENPRRIFGIKNKGRLALGFDADITVVDLKKERTIDNSWIASRCGWTPFHGMKVTGWPKMVFLQGQLAMQDDQILKRALGRAVMFTETK